MVILGDTSCQRSHKWNLEQNQVGWNFDEK